MVEKIWRRCKNNEQFISSAQLRYRKITTFDSNEKVSHLERNEFLRKETFLIFYLLTRFVKNGNPSSLSFIKGDFLP